MSVEIQKILDYSRNLALMLEQYKDSNKLKGLIDSMNDQADDLEQALFEIRDLFYLNSAEGIQLDIIGSIFNETRKGRSDVDYRSALKIKNALLLTSGEPESIIGIVKSLFGGTYAKYIPSYPAIPAGFYIFTDGTISQNELESFSPSGVQPYLASYLLLEDDSFITFEDGGKLFIVS